jgi:hypothetical protein
MKVRNMFNAHEYKDNEVFTEPSQTVPDQALTIREILKRYASGQPLGGSLEPIYEGDEGDGIDPRRLDLAERQELEIAAREELAVIEKRLKSTRITTDQRLSKEQIEDIQSQDVENIKD